MQGLTESLAVILGFVLRLGIPFLVTLFFVRLLRRLDERWQREGAVEVSEAFREAPLFSALRCWIANDCPPEQQENCPAFIEAVRPCWQVYRENGSVKQECLECEVFQQAPVPVSAQTNNIFEEMLL